MTWPAVIGVRIAACWAWALCTHGALASTGPDCDIRLHDESPGLAKFQVRAGARFTVCLDANPSTGFSWAMPFAKSQGLDRVLYLGSQYRQDVYCNHYGAMMVGVSDAHYIDVEEHSGRGICTPEDCSGGAPPQPQQ